MLTNINNHNKNKQKEQWWREYLPAFNCTHFNIQYYLPGILLADFKCISNSFPKECSIFSLDDLKTKANY